MTTKITLNNIADTALATLTGPKITTIVYPGDDTATDTAGGATINLTGGGFQSGCSVLVSGTASSVVTFISSTQISFIAPALSAGTYVIYVINPDGGTAISIPGISYSGTPNWTTTAGSLGNAYETGAISATLTATGDAPITYTLASGTLPTGSTLASNGTLSGTAVATASATTYTFTVSANDAQNQTTNRAFSLTINPDVVTWSSPADNTTYTVTKDSVMSNVTMSATSAAGGSITYTADTLPTGLSITGANIAGTPTVSANTTTVLTATSTATRTATKTINWVVNVGNDNFFKYNTLLLQGTSTTFVDDASTNNFAVSIFGDTKPNNFNPYTPGYYSNFLDGTGDYLTVPANAALGFGTGDFTIETWTYVTGTPTTAYVFDMRFGSGDLTALIFTQSSTTYSVYVNGSAPLGDKTPYVSYLNKWVHWAIVRSSGTVRVYINGVQDQSFTAAGSIITSGLALGARTNLVETFVGYISNFRIVKGTAVYTSAFTPSTTPLTAITNTSLLICQSNRFIDNSTNAFTITVTGDTKIQSFNPFTPNNSYSTYGSGYFDGTDDRIQLPSSANFTLVPTTPWTMEAWIYPTTNYTPIFWQNGGAQGILITNAGDRTRCLFGGTTGSGAGDGAIGGNSRVCPANSWSHVAITCDGNHNFYISVNGLRGTAVNRSSENIAYTRMTLGYIGAQPDLSSFFIGYIAGVRVVNGTEIYTGNFTPPTAPLTAVGNTQLLTLQNNQPVNNSVFLDNSTNNFLVTRNGNTTQGTFSPYGGNWSNYFDGTGDYLAVTGIPVPATGTFTYESWINTPSIPGGSSWIYTQRQSVSATRFGMALISDSTGFHVIATCGSNPDIASTTDGMSYNTWNHVAVVRDGSNNLKIFVNGVLNTTSANWSYSIEQSEARIGFIGNSATQYFIGYISNTRVTNTAVYSTTFTPSTTPLTAISGTSLLTCQSNRLIDNSINNFAITKNGDVAVQRFSPFSPASVTPTSYSGYFDGTGDYLSLASSSAFDLAAGDFTIEFWMNTNASQTSNARAIGNWNNDGWAANKWSVHIKHDTSTRLTFWVYNASSSTAWLTSSTVVNGIGWVHVAIVRSGTSWSMFINGAREATATSSAAMSSGVCPIQIGGTSSGFEIVTGYISNIRMVKGTAVYSPSSTTITVPTAPLTAIANTSLLTLQSTSFIDNSANNFAITAVGDTKPTQQNPFGFTSATTTGYSVSTIGGSGYFDGSGDYLTVPSNTAFGFGTGDFTIEGWFYFTGTISTYQRPWWMGDDNDNLEINASVIRFGGASLTVITGPTAVANTWYHIAYSRQSGSGKLFVNGTQVGSTTASSYSSSARTVTLMATSGGANPSTGYISDFRIVKGTALYTSNFVPPSQPLTAIQNSSLLLNMTGAGIYDASTMNNMETVGDAKISTAVSKFGGSSIYFDGSGDYVQIPASNLLDFGTGDFTIECWVYNEPISTNYPSFIASISGWSAGASGHRFDNVGYANKFWFGLNGSGGVASGDPFMASTNTFSHNTWYHYALTRSGNTWRMFVNGNLESTQTYSGSYNAAFGGMRLGYSTWDGSQGWWQGYLDDLRITKGYARYTANFTAPTSEFKTF